MFRQASHLVEASHACSAISKKRRHHQYLSFITQQLASMLHFSLTNFPLPRNTLVLYAPTLSGPRGSSLLSILALWLNWSRTPNNLHIKLISCNLVLKCVSSCHRNKTMSGWGFASSLGRAYDTSARRPYSQLDRRQAFDDGLNICCKWTPMHCTVAL